MTTRSQFSKISPAAHLTRDPQLQEAPPPKQGGLFAKGGGAFSKMDPQNFFGAFGAGVHF